MRREGSKAILRNPDGSIYFLEANYIYQFLALSNLIDFISDNGVVYRVWNEKLCALCLILLYAKHKVTIVGSSGTAFITGYLLQNRDELLKELSEYIFLLRNHLEANGVEIMMSSKPSEIIEILMDIDINIKPLAAGPILLKTPIGYMINLPAATNRLFFEFKFPSDTDKMAKYRATHFEIAIQNIINATKWKPSKELRQIRGRVLRLLGKAVTDIDSIGENEGILLLISCKSIMYSDEYHFGKHSLIRNHSDNIIQYVEYWKERLAIFEANKIGDNYNFEKYGMIIGVVCTPALFFVKEGIATEEATDGLYNYASSSELIKWLKGESIKDDNMLPTHHLV